MLHTRELIPPLTPCEPQGSTVHAWDFKQKKNLVIAFLDVDCALCEQFIRTLIEHAVGLDEKEAVELLAFIKEPASSLTNSLPSGIIAGVDVDSRGALGFLGEDGPPMQELRRRAVFVTDRHGEISAHWIVGRHEFPRIEEILSSLNMVEIACEECGVSDWSVVETPVLSPERANTALFYSINNCRSGLRGIPFGNFLIKQVVTELAAELPKIRTFSTLSPLPRFARALRDRQNEYGFTWDRLSRLLADFAEELTAAARCDDSVESLFRLLEDPLANRGVLTAPIERLALAYIAQARQGGKLYDPVATFHLSNGARLERINAFGNKRLYGIEASFGVTVNYRYPPADLEENHERFVRHGQIRVSSDLYREYRIVADAWRPVEAKSTVRVPR